jgi:hypothetical protein
MLAVYILKNALQILRTKHQVTISSGKVLQKKNSIHPKKINITVKHLDLVLPVVAA